MEPVEVGWVVLVRGGKGEGAIAVDVDDVFDAGSGFGEGEGAVLDDRSLTERIDVFDGLRGEDGGALVEVKIVGNLQFFAEPRKALGLGGLEVVDC